MANRTENCRAVCPYWQGCGEKSIRCEGIVSVTIINQFEQKTDRIRHEERYCRSIFGWQDCSVAKKDGKKYDE